MFFIMHASVRYFFVIFLYGIINEQRTEVVEANYVKRDANDATIFTD